MFIFRTRRTHLLARLCRLEYGEAGEEVEEGDSRRRRRITNLLSRLDLGELERLVEAVERGECCQLPDTEDRRSLVCQMRWPNLSSLSPLVRLPTCPTTSCSNPFHWARLVTPDHDLSGTPSGLQADLLPGYSSTSFQSSLPSSSSSSLSSTTTPTYLHSYQGDSTSTASSVATGGGNTFTDQSGLSWCRLAYWEERVRVGPQYQSHSSCLQIFCQPSPSPSPHQSSVSDSLSLPAIMATNLRASQSTLRTREKIGLGVLLSRDEAGVWAHNRTDVPLFVNSPTLDIPNSRTFSVFKIPPGYSMQIFNLELSALYQRIRDPAAYEGPYDPHAVRLSFAKGWGAGYSRQSIECCPCWLEILLNPSAL